MEADNASRTIVSLFESWYSSLVRYASRSTGSFALAEDLVQETFMQLYRELREGKEIRHPKAWTLCVLRRLVGKHVRTFVRQGGTPQSLDVLDTLPVGHTLPAVPGMEWDEVSRLFSVLTRREEEVLLLRMEARKYREIAALLGISASSVNTLLARALRKLQRAAKGSQEAQPESSHVEKPAPKTLQ
jgi:RNA polymerase sigma-70 factor (ECF subfamily)